MINQNEIFWKWVACQKTNPPKITGRLEKMKGRCCLGNLCQLALPDSVAWREGGTLPYDVCKMLNILGTGALTGRGAEIARIWIRENQIKSNGHIYYPTSLSEINDSTESTHSDIGFLLEHLAWVEREHGISCFFQ